MASSRVASTPARECEIRWAWLCFLLACLQTLQCNAAPFSQRTKIPFFKHRPNAQQSKDGDTEDAAGLTWPVHHATVQWRTRRKFDRQEAIKEVGYPTKSTGGLNNADIAILAKIYLESESVYETGIGESTKIAIFTGVPRYTGADGALEWVNIAMKGAPPHYRFHWADIGAIKAWSKPVNKKATPKWPMYTYGALAAESKGFDFYLVDGRFRVASVAACFLHAANTGLKRDQFRVGLHDFKVRSTKGTKDHYRAVLRIGDVVDGFNPATSQPTADMPHITILRRKAGVTDNDIYKLWEEYAVIPN